MKTLNTIALSFSLLLTFVLSAQLPPVQVTNSTSGGDNKIGFSCTSINSTLNYYLLVVEPVFLHSINASLENIKNEVVSITYEYDGSIDNYSKKDIKAYSKNSIVEDKLVPARYLVTLKLDSPITMSQIDYNPFDSSLHKEFNVITEIRYSMGEEVEKVDFNLGFRECNKNEEKKTTEISIVDISTVSNSNQILIEFEVAYSETTLSIEAYSLGQLGIKKSLITGQKFGVGFHRLLFDNTQISNGISQIVITKGEQFYTGKTIRL